MPEPFPSGADSSLLMQLKGASLGWPKEATEFSPGRPAPPPTSATSGDAQPHPDSEGDSRLPCAVLCRAVPCCAVPCRDVAAGGKVPLFAVFLFPISPFSRSYTQ